MLRSYTMLALTVLSLCSLNVSGQSFVAHTGFDNGLEGWQVRDTLNGAVTYFTPTWMPNGGVPDGHMSFQDVTPGGYIFEAPNAFHGDFSALVGTGGVFYDWGADHIMPDRRSSVSFYNGSVRMWAASGQGLPTNVWTRFDFGFDLSAGWKVDYGSGAQTATLADLQYVLSNVTDMTISGETWTGIIETTWVDNPTIYRSIPAPGALALLGVAGILTGRRRQRS